MNKIIYTAFFILFIGLNLNANILKITSKSEIITTDTTLMSQNAALIMQKYLQQIIGEPIKISDEVKNKKSSIILIQQDSKYASNFSFYKMLKALNEDGFIIKSEDGNIIIAGVNQRALFYGIYHFLERYMGCKFLSKDFEIVPKKTYVELNDINDIQEPKFLYREIFSSESDNLEFATKIRLNGRLGHRNSNQYQNKDFPKGKAIYNQFVSSELIDDESYECNGQYDFSKNKVASIALDSVNKKLSQMSISQDDFILLEHEDRDSYCTNGLKDGQVPGEPFLKYSSYIAKNLKNEFSKTKVLYQAYQWSRAPSKKVEKLPKNMTIFFSPIEADFSKPLDSWTNRAIFNDLKGWDKFENDIFIWHYITNFGGYFQPYPNLYALDDDIKLFASLKHIRGLFLQSSYGTFGGELADLRTWVFSKLLWSPDSDIDVLIKEFCDAYYGNASQDVQKYLRELHKRVDGKLFVKSSINAKYLQPDSLRYIENILEIGLKKVEDSPIHKAHLLELFSGIDYVRVMRGDEGKYLQKSKKRLKVFLDQTEGINYFSEGGSIKNIKKIIDIDRKTPLPPKESRGLKENIDWFDFQEYTLKLCCADLVSDINSSDGVSAVMKGDLGDWGFQLDILNFPKGKWDIYASVKVKFDRDIDLVDSADIAFYYGIHPTFMKGVKLFAQCKGGVYKSVKIGSIDTKASNAKTIWLSPPEDSKVKAIYVDRIYIVRKK